MHLFSASKLAVVGSAIALANSLLANCNSIRSADKHASRMTLKRYYVESLCESLIVRQLSLVLSNMTPTIQLGEVIVYLFTIRDERPPTVDI